MAEEDGPLEKQRMTASRLRDNWIPAVAGSGRPLRANATEAFNNGATNTGGRMAEPRHIPRNAVVVEQYEDLNSFTQAFAAGHLRFLVVVGPAGTGKSRAMRNAVADRAAWVDGNATAFGVYCAAFMHQDQPIVLDDVDALYRDANGIRLLKQLCQSEPSRLLSWYSDPQYMERRGVPLEFTTSSPVAIIANRWSTVNADVAALEDRGHMIAFDPSPIEIHRQAAQWFHDQEIFEFVSGYLHLIANHSFRTYLLALELKKAQMDWRRTILSRFLSGPALLVAQLKADPTFKSEAERVKAFREGGGGNRATYFNYAKKLHPSATESVGSDFKPEGVGGRSTAAQRSDRS